jgi:hypothetical protein
MYFEAEANKPKILLDIKGYKIYFDFVKDETKDISSEVFDNSVYYNNFIDGCDLIVNISDNYVNFNIYSSIDINNIDFDIYSDNSIILLNRNAIEFRGIDNEILFYLNYININDEKNIFKQSSDYEYSKSEGKYNFKIKNIKKNNSVNIGIGLSQVGQTSIASVQSISAKDRDIYKPFDGDTAFAIYLFQGFYENPETGERIIDYPLNYWKGVQVAGTVPLSSAIIGNNAEYEESYNNGKGLDSFTIYIEFVCNKIIASEGFAPQLYYSIIPPSDSALHLINQAADFVGNINGVSVYRGQYTVHKQSSPLYIDGIYKIIFKVEKSSYSELIFKVPVQNIYAIVGVSHTGDEDLIS